MAAKKLFRGPWSKQDIRFLRKFFPNGPTRVVANLLGRPYEAVKKQASRMGLAKSKKYLRTAFKKK